MENCINFNLSVKGDLRIALKDSWMKFWIIVMVSANIATYAYITVQIVNQ